MRAETIYTRLLNDQEMSAHLEKEDTLFFKGLGREWQQIERQVERLGFGERYDVSQTTGPRESSTKVRPLPARSIVT
jgi:hypothetical protein